MEATLLHVQNATSSAYTSALFKNSRVECVLAAALTPVPRIRDLALPDNFLVTLQEFREMTRDETIQLLRFYDVQYRQNDAHTVWLA
jgi:hypothetical protein